MSASHTRARGPYRAAVFVLLSSALAAQFPPPPAGSVAISLLTSPTSAPLGAAGPAPSPTDLATADFNADLVLDAVTANAGTGNLSFISLSGAAAVIPRPAAVPVGRNPIDLVAADLNGASGTDLVVLYSGPAFGGAQLHIHTFLGTPAGLVAGTLVATLNAGSAPAVNTRRLGVGDFDGDGDTDLAVVSPPGFGGISVQTYVNSGGGAFVPGAVLSAGATVSADAVFVADADLDLDLDLFVAVNPLLGSAVPAHLQVYANNGVGVFANPFPAPAVNPLGALPLIRQIVAANIYNPGLPALPEVIAIGDASAQIYFGPGTAAPPTPAIAFAVPAWAGVDADLVDLDNDLFPDVALGDATGGVIAMRNIVSTLSFVNDGAYLVAVGATGNVACDFSNDLNADGYVDAVACAAGGVGLLAIVENVTTQSGWSTIVNSGCWFATTPSITAPAPRFGTSFQVTIDYGPAAVGGVTGVIFAATLPAAVPAGSLVPNLPLLMVGSCLTPVDSAILGAFTVVPVNAAGVGVFPAAPIPLVPDPALLGLQFAFQGFAAPTFAGPHFMTDAAVVQIGY